MNKQSYKYKKRNKLLNIVDYDHKDNDKSKNNESNSVALCPNYHAIDKLAPIDATVNVE